MRLFFPFLKVLKIKGEYIVKISFTLGDEWIYFKFYSGAQNAERILLEVITPSIDHLLIKDKIDQWFFIRYADHDLHFRVRLHFKKPSYIGNIVRTIYKFVSKFVEEEIVRKVQTDTYQLKIERYGIHTMKLSEKIFFLDSMLFLNTLQLLMNPQGDTQRWHFSLKSIDCLLDCLNLNSEQKLTLLEGMKENFSKEFGSNHSLKNQLNNKFAREWKGLGRSLNPLTEKESIITPLPVILRSHRESLTPLVNEIDRTHSIS
jgi:thiopeptide-type bacteriocin biosynthesis protein